MVPGEGGPGRRSSRPGRSRYSFPESAGRPSCRSLKPRAVDPRRFRLTLDAPAALSRSWMTRSSSTHTRPPRIGGAVTCPSASAKYRAGQYSIAEGVPDPPVAVDGNGILDPHLGRCSANVLDVSLDFELRSVDAEHKESALRRGTSLNQLRTYGRVRIQLIQVKVQNSTSTCRPRSDSRVSGSVLTHPVAPANEGSPPSIGNSSLLGMCVIGSQ